MRQVDEGTLAASEGAARLGVTRRHMRRLMRRFEREGDGAAVHGLRGRRSNRAHALEVREQVLALAAEPVYAGFGPTLLAEHARRRRPRRAALGELVQWDSSVHAWLDDRGPVGLMLVALHDDATARMQHGRFVARDTGRGAPAGDHRNA